MKLGLNDGLVVLTVLEATVIAVEALVDHNKVRITLVVSFGEVEVLCVVKIVELVLEVVGVIVVNALEEVI